MPTVRQAEAVVQAIVRSLPSPFDRLLERIWLAGSLGRGADFGADIDLVLAVERQAFHRYLGLCARVYGGIDAIASNPAPHLAGVDEYQVRLERTRAALLTIGVTLDALDLAECPPSDLDIICLPRGFADSESDDRRYLLEKIRGFADWLDWNPIESLVTLHHADGHDRPKR